MLLRRVLAWSLIGVAGCPAGSTQPPSPSTPEPEVAAAPEPVMYPALMANLESFARDVDTVAADRRAALDRIAAFVAERHAAGEPVRLTFICTGNSRRSHLGQLWAAAAARYHGFTDVETYSGGTEPSAFNERAIAAVERAGFVVDPVSDGDNPHHAVRLGEDVAPIEAFSKRYDDPTNPKGDFVAVMTCTDADQACPLVPGAALRVSLPYEDPKVADGTPEEAARYDERSRQIATEMLYLFAQATKR